MWGQIQTFYKAILSTPEIFASDLNWPSDDIHNLEERSLSLNLTVNFEI